MKIIVFWDVMPCKLVDRYQIFGGISCLSLQCRWSRYVYPEMSVTICQTIWHHAQEDCHFHIKCWSENLGRRGHVRHLGANGRIVLKWILEKEGSFLTSIVTFDCLRRPCVMDLFYLVWFRSFPETFQ
jgi:hypothetical protein